MSAFGNPLEVSELIDRILGFLDALEDFHACALVSRAWVYPSQSRIFSSVKITGNLNSVHSQVAGLLAAFTHSPHLPRFISSLSILDLEHIHPEDFQILGEFSYKSLKSLGIVCHDPDRPSQVVLTLQRFLRVPCLVSAFIFCTFHKREEFLQIWDGCSQNIRHLAYSGIYFFDCFDVGPLAMAHVGHMLNPSEGRIKLESLAEDHSDLIIDSWLRDPDCPFDASCLKAFKFCLPSNQLRGTLHDARDTIEVISIGPMVDIQIIDLAAFRRLVQLDICWSPGFEWQGVDYVFDTIRTIPIEHRDRLAALRFDIAPGFSNVFHSVLKLDSWMLAEIARQICTLQDDFPGLKVIEISIDPATPALASGVEGYFAGISPEIAVQWNFEPDNRLSWYTKIV